MRIKVHHFSFNRLFNTDPVNNVLLRPVLDSNKAQSQTDILSFQHALGISSSVHNIDFCDDSDGPYSLGVELASHLQPIGSGHVCVGWQNTQNNCSRITDVSRGHVPRDLLNIVGLVRSLHWNSGDSRQVDQSQVRTSVRIDCQHNWLVDDIFTRTANFIRQKIDRVFYF